ncbi:MAG TPA: phosphotransferase [Dissulfurispiraceae bacterium]|nr:phosphotransferase [Dissulfurispiraceae bacterium]
MINELALKDYLETAFPMVTEIAIRKLGSGVQGSGFLISMCSAGSCRQYVVKTLFPEGLGHDYPSDRAGVFLLDLDEYNNLPGHVHAVDVLAEMEGGAVKSIGGGKEYYLLMELTDGVDYFRDLESFRDKGRLDAGDKAKIRAMTSYLARIHFKKKESRSLYLRKVRDTIGHGECLMGVFDTYPDGTLSPDAMAEIEKMCIDWRAKLRDKSHRLSMIHGDFHPGNIWFKNDDDFVLLDRSRGPWGEPADDVTALAINYVFFSLRYHGDVRGAYLEGLTLFFDEYLRFTADSEILGVLAPFFAFRGVVVANPVFYPDVTSAVRQRIFSFVRNVLSAARFDYNAVNDYSSP